MGTRGQQPIAGPLPEEQPRDDADEDHLQVAHDRRQPGPEIDDGVVEESQVGGEEDARREGEHPLAPRARTLAALLPPCQGDERRDGEGGAVGGRRRGRDGGEDDEDAAEGDAHGAGHDGQRERAFTEARTRATLGIDGLVCVGRAVRGGGQIHSPIRWTPDARRAVAV